jgi:hypothetical protein
MTVQRNAMLCCLAGGWVRVGYLADDVICPEQIMDLQLRQMRAHQSGDRL